jgi:hypothetical protein
VYLSRDDHGWESRSRERKTNVGKYSFVNRIIRDWNRLPTGVLKSLPCKLDTFRKWFREAVTRKEAPSGD